MLPLLCLSLPLHLYLSSRLTPATLYEQSFNAFKILELSVPARLIMQVNNIINLHVNSNLNQTTLRDILVRRTC